MLCASNFLFTASFQMMIPELPAYLKAMGGQAYIGYIIALFTLTAGLARPFSGKLTDTVGRVPIMVTGSLVCVLCGFIYPFVSTVWAFLLLRFFHGFSTGTKPTATAAYVADIVPETNRGEAAGMLGIFTAIGMSIGPAFGSAITNRLGLNNMFFSSSLLALFSVAILYNLKETLPISAKKPLSSNSFIIKWADVFEPRVTAVFIITVLICFSTGCVLTVVPDQTAHLGIANKGFFFTIYTGAALAVRVFFSKLSDTHGRVFALKIACASIFISMILMALANSTLVFIIGGIFFGAGVGLGMPALTAWTIDLSLPAFRGRGLATMYMALELGIGLGALVSGYIFNGIIENIKIAYTLAAILAFISIVSFYIFKSYLQKLKNMAQNGI